MSYVALYSVYQTPCPLLQVHQREKQEKFIGRETDDIKRRKTSVNEKNKSEGQPCARKAQSDCCMSAAEPFCGIAQMVPRVKPWRKR